MEKNYILSSLKGIAVIGAMMLSSCATSTPETRIKKNPDIYNTLTESQQSLVKQGLIKKGMDKKAVFLAWGKAASVTQGNKDGQNFERWIYATATPVYHGGFSSHYGYGGYRGGFRGRGRFGHGGHGGFGHRGFGYGGYGGVSYLQSKRATVSFNQSDKVVSWESRR